MEHISEGTLRAEMSKTRVKAASSRDVTFSPEVWYFGNSRGNGEWPFWREGPYERLVKETTAVVALGWREQKRGLAAGRGEE